MSRYLWLLGLLLTFLPQMTYAQVPVLCEGLPEPRLVKGEQGRVLPGTPNNLRAEASTEGDLLTEIPAEAVFLVMDGPECSDDYAWWQVAYGEFVGWTVENMDAEAYAVEPVTPTTTAVSFGGVSFELDSRIAESATGQLVPPPPQAGDLPFWQQTPPFINFALNGVFDNPGTMAQIAVYPAQELEDIQQTTAIGDLQTLLEDRPVNPTPAALPIINAERVFVSQPAYLDFEGGSGVRFLVYFSQAADPLTSGSLWYVFQGLTTQGEHYVQVYLPIATRLFDAVVSEDFDYSAFISDYDGYLQNVRELVDEADSADFAPLLDTLDNLVESFEIDPVGVSATFAGDVSLTVRCEITAIADTRLRAQPDVNAPVTDYLPADIPVEVDGQFQRRGENFPWWRLASNDEVRPLPGISSLRGARWIRADFTYEDGNCAGLPMVSNP
jgi:hypothetical protein